MRIAVIYGGDKTVDGAVINQTINSRSWKSYRSVAEDIAAALGRLGFRHVSMIPDDMRLGQQLREEGIHLAWLNSGGVQGYHPTTHTSAMLEMFGVPYVGHDPLMAGTLDNKHAFKRALLSIGVPTAPFVVVDPSHGRFEPDDHHRFRSEFGLYHGPYIIKPVNGRASLNVRLVDDEADLCAAVARVSAVTEGQVLVEAYLPGREYCVAVCGYVTARGGILSRSSEPFVFATVERVLDREEKIFTSMDRRPITADRVRPLDPARNGREIAELQKIARSIFFDLSIEGLVRLDVRSDADGRIFVLEANPKPDLKAPRDGVTSLICEGLGEFGMTYDDLILSLLADRIDLLFSQRRGTVTQIARLVGTTLSGEKIPA